MFELIKVGAAPNLSEAQAFKNFALQMMIDQTFTFRRFFFKSHHIQVLTLDMNVGVARPPPPIEMLRMIKMSQKRLSFF